MKTLVKVMSVILMVVGLVWQTKKIRELSTWLEYYQNAFDKANDRCEFWIKSWYKLMDQM